MAANHPAIRASIALKVAAVSGIAVSTSSNFGGVVDVPRYMVNTVETIEMLNHESPGIQQREFTYPADLLLGKQGETNTAIENAEGILEGIYTAALVGVTLGYPALVYDSWIERSDVGELEYAGQQWIGAKQIWHVRVLENVDRSS